MATPTSPNLQKSNKANARPLLLTIRFSASIPDLDLDVPSPEQTTVVSLKHLIRARLTPPLDTHRIRFIYQGKILQDSHALSTVLRNGEPSHQPSSVSSQASRSLRDDPKSKKSGKAKAVDGVADPSPARTFVICSIGDSLSPSELADEAVAAAKPPTPPTGPDLSSNRAPSGANAPQSGPATSRSTAAPQRGFDRLLAAGFTHADVSQLRLQFRDIHAQRHTPDSMPSPDSMRNLEDLWMDANAGDVVPGGATSAAGTAPEGLGAMHVHLDGLIKGMMMGFFWPLGGLAWVTREDGMVSQRWKVWIGFGVAFSVAIGIYREIFGGR